MGALAERANSRREARILAAWRDAAHNEGLQHCQRNMRRIPASDRSEDRLSPAGDFVESGFGDWEWYARAQEQWHRVFATVLWPTRGTLARRDHFANDATSLRDSMPWATFDEFVVEAGDAVRVRARLDAQFAAGNRERVIRSGLRMHFVPWDRDYWFADTCADAVVEWLQELGCRSSWVPLCFDVAIETSNQGP
jgi:hypothetical protein